MKSDPDNVTGIINGLLGYFHESEWRYVCDDYFSGFDAYVACYEITNNYLTVA